MTTADKNMSALNPTRRGIQDIWNAFMVSGAEMGGNDIPFCPTTAVRVPTDIITWTDACHLYRCAIRAHKKDFYNDAFVCWYIDDAKFDGRSGIWNYPYRALDVLKHFGGIITPDFSICQDFPKPWKLFNVYRMRAFGYWCGKNGISVVNNIRWGTRETWGYCFDGIPRHSIVAIGTVASGLRKRVNCKPFEDGLREMMRVLAPHTVIVYGSAKYACLRPLSEAGIRVVAYPCATARRFADLRGVHR